MNNVFVDHGRWVIVPKPGAPAPVLVHLFLSRHSRKEKKRCFGTRSTRRRPRTMRHVWQIENYVLLTGRPVDSFVRPDPSAPPTLVYGITL